MSAEVKVQVVRINRLMDSSGPIKAICDVKFGEMFTIKGFRVIELSDGFEIDMPRKPGKGKWYNIFTTIKKEFEDYLKEETDYYLSVKKSKKLK